MAVLMCLGYGMSSAQHIRIVGDISKVIFQAPPGWSNELKMYGDTYWHCPGVELEVMEQGFLFEDIDEVDGVYTARIYPGSGGYDLRLTKIILARNGKIQTYIPNRFSLTLNSPLNEVDIVFGLRLLCSAISNRALFSKYYSRDSAKKYGEELEKGTLLVTAEQINPDNLEKIARYYDWSYKLETQSFVDSAIVRGEDYCVLYSYQWTTVYSSAGGYFENDSRKVYEIWVVYSAKTGHILSITDTRVWFKPKKLAPSKFKKIQRRASKRMSERRLMKS